MLTREVGLLASGVANTRQRERYRLSDRRAGRAVKPQRLDFWEIGRQLRVMT